MSPKPLPSQLRTGVDICHVPRIKNVLKLCGPASFERWGSKVFNSHEWPEFVQKTEQWRSNKNTGRLSHDSFPQWLAGRWAAKEAAIKAHANRNLSRLDISILHPLVTDPQGPGKTVKPWMLIDPGRRIVMMSITTAITRGLRGAPLQRNTTTRKLLSGTDGSSSEADTSETLPLRHRRRLLIQEEDRQLADLSISHDGEYAIAVCLALDEVCGEDPEPIIDDGTGEPIHEPEWGDVGFGKKSRAE